MGLQEVTIDLIYLGLTALGDPVKILAGLLVLAGTVDGIVSVLQLLRRPG